jgi:hypothetical protein
VSSDGSKAGKEVPSKRQYPAAYERAVPIALAVIALAIVILLVIIVIVVLGLYPGG